MIFSVHWSGDLPGKPDLANNNAKLSIFVQWMLLAFPSQLQAGVEVCDGAQLNEALQVFFERSTAVRGLGRKCSLLVGLDGLRHGDLANRPDQLIGLAKPRLIKVDVCRWSEYPEVEEGLISIRGVSARPRRAPTARSLLA